MNPRRVWWRHCSLIVGLLAVQGFALAAPPATVLVVGDSLSAEYGIARGSGWVALLQARLDRRGRGERVVNASVSGDTTAGGRARLPALLAQHRPTHVVLELGGNDALRGLPMAHTEDNLRAMTRASQAAGAQVLLLGMQVPPNYGRAYNEAFAQAFVKVAQQEKAALVPFFLSGVADAPDPTQWFQPDRIHPLATAHPRLLENAWAGLKGQLPR